MKLMLSSLLQSRMNMLIYQKIGWDICFYYLIILGKIYYLVKRNEREKIVKAVEYVFKDIRRDTEVKRIAKDVFSGIMSHYYEKVFQAHENIEQLKDFYIKRIDARDLYKLDDELKKGKGVIFVTGHYGAIEYIPFYLAVKKYPISAVGKFTTKQLKDLIIIKGKEVGLKIIDGNQKNNVLNQIIKELKEKKIVFIECDEIEEWKPSRKETILFLRKMIGVDRIINVIHKRTNAEVVFGLLHRITIRKYHLVIENYQDMFLRYGKFTSSVGGLILKALEEYIYRYPEEWYQWKNFPEIKAYSTNKYNGDMRFIPNRLKLNYN